MEDHGIYITKSNERWTCSLLKTPKKKGGKNKLIDVVLADSFPELMVEIGNKNWIGEINKNK